MSPLVQTFWTSSLSSIMSRSLISAGPLSSTAMVFWAMLWTSAVCIAIPFSSSFALTASSDPGSVMISKTSPSSVRKSSAPASRASSIRASSFAALRSTAM